MRRGQHVFSAICFINGWSQTIREKIPESQKRAFVEQKERLEQLETKFNDIIARIKDFNTRRDAIIENYSNCEIDEQTYNPGELADILEMEGLDDMNDPSLELDEFIEMYQEEFPDGIETLEDLEQEKVSVITPDAPQS